MKKKKCSVCQMQIMSSARHIRHVLLRHYLANNIKCSSCNFVAKDSWEFGTHVYEKHVKSKNEVQLSEQEDLRRTEKTNFSSMTCQHSDLYCCGVFDSLKEYKQHVRDQHSKISLFDCIFESCHKTHNSSTQHLEHIRRYHKSQGEIKAIFVLQTVKQLPTVALEPELEYEDGDDNDFSCEDETTDEESEGQGISFTEIENILQGKLTLEPEDMKSLQKEACRFVLDLHTKKFVPFSVCLHIMKQITKLSKFTLQVMEYEISKVISTEQDSTCLTLQIKKILQDKDISACFEPLLSRWKFDRFVEENFKCVQPTEVKVNNTLVGHYSSIPDLLHIIKTDPTFVPTKEISSDGIIRSNYDALILKDNSFYQDNPDTMIIKLYSDAVTVTDPLGMANKEFKILKVNMIVVNVDAWKNSRLSCIFPIFTGNLSKCKGNELEVFKPIIDDLKLLEKGVNIKGMKIQAMVLTYLADGLEAFTLLNLACSFSSNFICKMCIARYEELNDSFHQRIPVWRTNEMYAKVMKNFEAVEDDFNRITIFDDNGNIEAYKYGETITQQEIPPGSVPLVNPNSGSVEMILVEEQPDEIKGDPYEEHKKQILSSLKDDQQDLGHKGETIFDDLQAFSPWNGFPPDLLHDWSEGMGTKEAAGLILACFKENKLTVDQFNQELKYFKSLLKDDVKDWPKGLSKGASKKLARLPYTGAATNVLIRILPAILNKYLPEDHPILRLSGYLNSIQELLYSECISDVITMTLEADITAYFDLRKKFATCFEFCKIVPKYHWILHYSSLGKLYGPLRLSSTTCFEHKHRETTTCVSSFRNYINVTFSVSRLDCYRIALDSETGLFPTERVEAKKKQKGPINEVRPFISDLTSCFEEITYKGTSYSVQNYIIVRASNPDEIFVGRILQILIDDDSVRLAVTCSNAFRHRRFRFFMIQEESVKEIISIDSLVSRQSMRSFKYLDYNCLSLKNCPMYTD